MSPQYPSFGCVNLERVFFTAFVIWRFPHWCYGEERAATSVRFEMASVTTTSHHQRAHQNYEHIFLQTTKPDDKKEFYGLASSSSTHSEHVGLEELSRNRGLLRRKIQKQLYLSRASRDLVGGISDTITTTSCSFIRSSASFKARLELIYLYQIEYYQDGNSNNSNSNSSKDNDYNGSERPDLSGIDRAVATYLAASLDQCDDQQRPANAVQISAQEGHKLSSSSCQKKSLASENAMCQVVRGTTYILLDGGASGVTPIAYTVIDLVLNDVQRLNEFTWMPLAHAEFLRPLAENLVLVQNYTNEVNIFGDDTASETIWENDDDVHDANVTVVVVAALVAFMLASTCFVMVWRKWHLFAQVWYMFPSPKSMWFNRKQKRQLKLEYWQCKRDSNLYWSQLDDDSRLNRPHSQAPGARYEVEDGNANHNAWMLATLHAMRTMPANTIPILEHIPVMEQLVHPHHISNMAVSDLTSDSESIKSSLKMDSIKEEECDEALILAELAMAEKPRTKSSPSEGKSSLSHSIPNSSSSSRDQKCHSYTSSRTSGNKNNNTNPDESEDEVVEFPAFMGAAHYYDKNTVDQVLSEAATCLSNNGLLWEKAGAAIPCSYYDNSDPDADTPVRSNVEKIETYDALGRGQTSYMADTDSEDDEKHEDDTEEEHEDDIDARHLMMPTLAGLPIGLCRRNEEPFVATDPVESIDGIPELSDCEQENDDTSSVTGNVIIPEPSHEVIPDIAAGDRLLGKDDSESECNENEVELDHSDNDQQAPNDDDDDDIQPQSDISVLEKQFHALFESTEVDDASECGVSGGLMDTESHGESCTVVTNDSVSPANGDQTSTSDNEFIAILKADNNDKESPKKISSGDKTSMQKPLRVLTDITLNANKKNSVVSPESRRRKKSISPLLNIKTAQHRDRVDALSTNCQENIVVGFVTMSYSNSNMSLSKHDALSEKPTIESPYSTRSKDLNKKTGLNRGASLQSSAARDQQHQTHYVDDVLSHTESDGVVSPKHGSASSSKSAKKEKVPRISPPDSLDGTEEESHSLETIAELKATVSTPHLYDADDEECGDSTEAECSAEEISVGDRSQETPNKEVLAPAGSASGLFYIPGSQDSIQDVTDGPNLVKSCPVLDEAEGNCGTCDVDEKELKTKNRPHFHLVMTKDVRDTRGIHKTPKAPNTDSAMADDLIFSEDSPDRQENKVDNSVQLFEEMTSPEGLRFLEDSSAISSANDSNDRRHASRSLDRSLQDLRLLGPVVTDSTSEDISLLDPSTTEDHSSKELGVSKEVEDDCDDEDKSESSSEGI